MDVESLPVFSRWPNSYCGASCGLDPAGMVAALAARAGLPVLWLAQDAAWGRFVVLADLDGRSVVLVRMNRPDAPAAS